MPLASKFDDHLPLYRQDEIFVRMGADIPESTLVDWVKDRSRRDQTVRRTV
jgi:transposase